MGDKKIKKKLKDVKKDLLTLGNEEMNLIKGGKKGSRWSPSCGGILPQ